MSIAPGYKALSGLSPAGACASSRSAPFNLLVLQSDNAFAYKRICFAGLQREEIKLSSLAFLRTTARSLGKKEFRFVLALQEAFFSHLEILSTPIIKYGCVYVSLSLRIERKMTFKNG